MDYCVNRRAFLSQTGVLLSTFVATTNFVSIASAIFDPDPVQFSVASGTATFVHPDPTVSPLSWEVSRVYDHLDRVLRQEHWSVTVTLDGNGFHAATLQLDPAYKTSTHLADQLLRDALAAGTQLRVRLRFANLRTEYIRLMPI